MPRSLLLVACVAIALSISVADSHLVARAAAAGAGPSFLVPGSAELEGEREGSDRWVIGGTEIVCGSLTYSGALAESSKTLEVLPEYGECRAKVLSGLIADFYQETCAYALHDLRPAGGARWRAAVDIRCGGAYDATGWDIYETQAKYTVAQALCQTRIFEGPDAGTAELRNLGGRRGGIEVRWRLRELDYRVYSLGGFGASLVCGSPPNAVAKDAAYTGAAKIFAGDLAGRSIPLRIGD